MRPATRRDVHRRGTHAALLAWIVLTSAATYAAAEPEHATSKLRAAVPSTRNSPGYVPLVDPDSASVLAGRRLDAPLVNHRFQGGEKNLEQLGKAICRALHRKDRDALLELCVRPEEFRDILWREFPQSRPATGLEWEDGWRALGNRLAAGTSQAVQDHGGRFHEFLRLEVDSVTRYRNFRMHSGIAIVVRDDTGEIRRMRWLRGVVERRGAFKIYSTDD